MGVWSRAGPILLTKIQAIVPAPTEDYFTEEICQKVEGRAGASSHYYRRACAEIRDVLRGTAAQGKPRHDNHLEEEHEMANHLENPLSP